MRKKKIEYNDAVPAGRRDMIMEAWIGRHWKQVIIVCLFTVIITIIWSMINISGLKSALKKQATAIENLSKRVIVASPDGRVVILQTIEVPDSYIVLILRDIVSKYLIFSSFEIQNVSSSDVNKFVEYEKIKNFVNYFCDSQKCKNDYKAFLNSIWTSYKDGILPEVIYTGSNVQETYKIQDKNFYYTLNLPVITYIVREGKWVKGEEIISFTLQGKIDLQQSDSKNPWGLKIATFKTTIPVKQK